MRIAIFSALLAALLPQPAWAEVRSDLTGIERTIHREPQYQADRPLYGLVVFGAEMKTRVWIVLDKSEPGGAKYDVAYVDRNSNGDLTEPNEKFTAPATPASDTRFTLPDFTDPATNQTHTQFTLRCSHGQPLTQMLSVQWCGDLKFGGGYPEQPDTESYLQFAPTAQAAPIAWLNGDGPFTFQRWYRNKLSIGKSTDVRLFIGVAGSGPSSFCAFQVHALPEGEGIDGVLHYETKEGVQKSVTFALLDKC